MRSYSDRRMRDRLVRALCLMAMAFATVMLIEAVWDAQASSAQADAGGTSVLKSETAFGRQELSRFVMEGDDAALGASELPSAFTAECFSATGLGEVRCTDGASVVGIVSDLEPESLYQTCSDALVSHGWLAVASGMEQRGSFVKDAGEYRWLFLDVSRIGERSSAVIVTQGVGR